MYKPLTHAHVCMLGDKDRDEIDTDKDTYADVDMSHLPSP